MNRKDAPRDLRRPALLRLAGLGAMLAAAATANVAPDAARWFGHRGPACLLGHGFGEHACPGCGLVRSVASCVQGDLAAAWTYHPAGVAVVACAAVLLVADTTLLVRGRDTARHLRRATGLTFTLAIVLAYLARVTAHLYPHLATP